MEHKLWEWIELLGANQLNIQTKRNNNQFEGLNIAKLKQK